MTPSRRQAPFRSERGGKALPPYRNAGADSARCSAIDAAVLLITSLIFLAITTDLPLPRYNMAWGEFNSRLSLDPFPPLVLGSVRLWLLVGGVLLACLALLRSLDRLRRTLGGGFVFFCGLLLAASFATLLPLPRIGVIADASGPLFAARSLALALVVVAGGVVLGRAWPSGLAAYVSARLEALGASGRMVVLPAAVALLGLLAVGDLRLDAIPHAMDEVGQVFQAKIFASGRLWSTRPPLPEMLSQFGILTEGGRWRAMWPPGNAILMVPFLSAGVLPLYPPAVSAMTVIALYAFVLRAEDRPTGWVAVLLLLTSPWFWAMGSSYMSHVPSALWITCFLACLVRALRGSLPFSLGTGLCLGAAAATREADALLLSLPFGLLWAFGALDPETRSGWLKRTAAMAAGLIPGLAFLLGTNTVVNGGPFVFGHDILFGGRFGFGFGPKPPGVLTDPLATPVHTLAEGFTNFRGLLTDLQLVLFGLGIPSLALVALGIPRAAVDRFAWAGLTALATYLAAYVFFPLDMTMFGPRYAYGALPLFVWFGARGAIVVHRRLAGTAHAFAVPGILAAGGLLAAAHEIPAALSSFDHGFAGVDRRIERALAGAGVNRAIVAIPTDPRGLRGNPFLYTSAFRLMRPDLRGIVPTRAQGDDSIAAALGTFADRPAFAWFAVYDGPFYHLRFVTASLVRLRRPGDPDFRIDREATLRRALNAYPAAVSRGSRSPEIWNLLGTVAWMDGDGKTARERFKRAIGFGPDNPDLWINLALLSLAEGREDEAREASRRALRLGGTLPPPLVRLLGSEHSEDAAPRGR